MLNISPYSMAGEFMDYVVVDRFIAVSHAVAHHTGLIRSRARYEVIPNFVPDDVGVLGPEDSCLRELPGDRFILFVGDLSECFDFGQSLGRSPRVFAPALSRSRGA